MTTEQGKKLFGTGLFAFGNALVWFRAAAPGGIFTLQPLNMFDACFRAEIAIGAIVAAYGILLWRRSSRKISLANCIIVSACVPVLLLCASKLTEWAYLVDRERGLLTLDELVVAITQITMVACIMVIGIWWADGAYMQERFHRHVRSGRFVK